MRRLWMLLLPLLFLPEFGVLSPTEVGTGELSDTFVAPYIIAVFFAGRRAGGGDFRRLRPILLALLGWALLSTLTINLRYGYTQLDYLQVSLVKLGKFAAYGLAGYLTTRALEGDVRARVLYPWVLLGICVFAAGTYISVRGIEVRGIGNTPLGFASSNGLSVAMAMLYSWMVAYWLSPNSNRAWRIALAVVSPILLVGFFFTDGRGGWLAALCALAYVAVRQGVRPPLVLVGLIGAVTLVATYQTEDGFRTQVDMTLDPSRLTQESEFAAAAGFDDGSRVGIWMHEAPLITNSPILGAGFYHRGAASRLWPTGSHNFWLQMFLELGLVGGSLVLVIVWNLWRSANSSWAHSAGIGVAGRAALIAAWMGGMSESYFYGGKILLALFLVMAPSLSLPFEAGTVSAARRRGFSPASGLA
jgi:O-antigen ligase